MEFKFRGLKNIRYNDNQGRNVIIWKGFSVMEFKLRGLKNIRYTGVRMVHCQIRGKFLG